MIPISQIVPILNTKIGVFIKNQCNNPVFTKLKINLSQTCQYFANIFGEIF
jgi:hypothetical protein